MGVIPTVRHCFCGCCRLDTGCKILGILGTVAGLLGIAAISLIIALDEPLSDEHGAHMFCKQWLNVPACDYGHAYGIVLGVLVTSLLICLLYTLVSILLVIGARKSNPTCCCLG
eukprot:TRINITY_DN20895_c0_g1_i1.p1 TRINITY_DN20895_c0_g1~~TRINITY_DN20895_c0_g1_i1.p1  ORF type:complete len:114 (-),score=16.67 TRINITY_DN20895_c0_g1_i1:37-378(-)